MARRGRTRGSKERAALRAPEALKLRLEGYSFYAIGEKLGVSHVQAFNDVQRALRENLNSCNPQIDEMREVEDQRLDELWSELRARLLNKKDNSLNLDVVDRMCRISERRSKLRGLDTPVKQSIAVGWQKEAEMLGVSEEQARKFLYALADDAISRGAGSDVAGSG